jgi:predicted transcriptional regulator
MSATTIGITVRLSKGERDRLRKLAKSEQRSLGGEIRKAVLEHLARSEAAGATEQPS